MIEHRIVSESVLYDTVLPSGNMYTKRLIERIVKQFKEDEKFREGMLCVPQSKLKENPYLDYTSVAGKIVNLWIDEPKQQLMAELLIMDTPCGRMIEESFRRCDTINVVPFGMADSIDVDGIHILSSDKYDLRYFEIVVVPYRRMRREMKTTGRRISNAFGFIGEVFDDLSYVEEAWNACGCGDSMRERIDEAIRTYKLEVEKMNEKVEKLE